MSEYLTKDGLEKLKKELDHLKKNGRREIAERIRLTAAHGDLKENAAYHEAKEDQGFLEQRIKELRSIIGSSQVIEKNGTDKVQIGSSVLINDGKKKEKYQIVGPSETNVSEGKISYKSPLGQTLLNKNVGDKVTIKSSEGETKYAILKIN